jgi:hypothetical protein
LGESPSKKSIVSDDEDSLEKELLRIDGEI